MSTDPTMSIQQNSPAAAGHDSIFFSIGSGKAMSYRVAAGSPPLRATALPRITASSDLDAESSGRTPAAAE